MMVASSSYLSGPTDISGFPDVMKMNGLLSAQAGSPSKDITDLCTTLESSGIPLYLYGLRMLLARIW
jgi:hypothetical protein